MRRPPAAEMTVSATSGTAASSTTTWRRARSDIPVRRSSAKGRLRSRSPPATAMVRLQPAMMTLSRIARSPRC